MSSRPHAHNQSDALVRGLPASGFALGRAMPRRRVAFELGCALALDPWSIVAIVHSPPTPCFHACSSRKQDVARGVVGELADLAFAGWAADNPGRARPSKLEELGPFANRKHLGTDPWGMSYAMSPSERGIRVVSAGPDRELGTVDDIAGSTP